MKQQEEEPGGEKRCQTWDGQENSALQLLHTAVVIHSFFSSFSSLLLIVTLPKLPFDVALSAATY